RYRAAVLRSDGERVGDYVRARRKLARGQDFRELGVVEPSLLIDNDAARPDEPAAEPQERDPEEADKERAERDPLAGANRFDRLEHSSPQHYGVALSTALRLAGPIDAHFRSANQGNRRAERRRRRAGRRRRV